MPLLFGFPINKHWEFVTNSLSYYHVSDAYFTQLSTLTLLRIKLVGFAEDIKKGKQVKSKFIRNVDVFQVVIGHKSLKRLPGLRINCIWCAALDPPDKVLNFIMFLPFQRRNHKC